MIWVDLVVVLGCGVNHLSQRPITRADGSNKENTAV